MGPYAKRSPSRRMVTTNNIANSFESKWKGPPTTADHRGSQRRRRGTGRAHLLIPNRGLDRYTRSGGRRRESSGPLSAHQVDANTLLGSLVSRLRLALDDVPNLPGQEHGSLSLARPGLTFRDSLAVVSRRGCNTLPRVFHLVGGYLGVEVARGVVGVTEGLIPRFLVFGALAGAAGACCVGALVRHELFVGNKTRHCDPFIWSGEDPNVCLGRGFRSSPFPWWGFQSTRPRPFSMRSVAISTAQFWTEFPWWGARSF